MMQSIFGSTLRCSLSWTTGMASRYAASTSEMARFETKLLATGENLHALGGLSGLWIGRV
jgi:hypothetical protein